MRKLLLLFISLAFSASYAQLYQGPAQGSVDSGKVVTTGTFMKVAYASPNEDRVHNKLPHPQIDVFDSFKEPRPDAGTLYQEDQAAKVQDTLNTLLLRNFAGIAQTNSIPPDPYIAVGPQHILATVNTTFAIYDKNGNTLYSIPADSWYGSVLANPGAFDPKVLYDQIDKRWVMVWLNQNDNSQTGYFLVSVSDDSIPLGKWYNYALPSHVNGTTGNGTWADYQGVGYDKDAIYITGNQFQFGGSFQYAKLRIIPKSELYKTGNTAGRVSYFDLWDFRYPNSTTQRIFNIRPSLSYTNSSVYHLLHAANGSSNFFTLLKVSNAATNPTVSLVNVPVSAYASAPNANQLGGSTILLEAGGSNLRFEPTYRDGFLWAVHATRNPVNFTYSTLHYVKINAATNTTAEESFFGSAGFWYSYPAIAVDKEHNFAVTYSRSGDGDYIGAYYATKFAGEPAGLNRSYTLQAGKANYVKDFGSGRNRWGDYMGAWLDPSNEKNIWLFTEYASALNTWGVWTGEILISPYAGSVVIPQQSLVDFGNVELTTKSDTLNVSFANFGRNVLRVDSLKTANAAFKLLTPVTLPLTLTSYDTLKLKYQFVPVASGNVNDTLKVYSTDASFKGIPLKAKGYVITPAAVKQLYATTATGDVLKVDKATGAGTLLGGSLFNSMQNVSVHPKTKVIYGVRIVGTEAEVVRVNSLAGDAYTLKRIPNADYVGASFDTSGVLYLARRAGQIYTFNLASKELVKADSVKCNLNAIAFHPKTNKLWGTIYRPVGTGKDRILKITLGTGDTATVGLAGYNVLINDLEFDELGNLYGVKGSTTVANDLIKIDTTTGLGTLIGSVGFNGITSIGYFGNSPVGIKDPAGADVPTAFSLGQNYPNPFNPSTTITFALPVDAQVTLTVYNSLGETVQTLLSGFRAAGTHAVSWDASRAGGSGIYFYELRAEYNGKSFKEIRKMILVK